MTGSVAAAALAIAAAGLLAWPARGARGAPGGSGGTTHPAGLRVRLVTAAAPVGAGLALLLLVPAWWFLAPVAAAAVAVSRRRSAGRPDGREQRRRLRELAAVLDQTGVCLAAGLATPAAIGAVLAASSDRLVPGGSARAAASGTDRRARDDDPLALLAEVAALLQIGAEPALAWRPAAREPALVPLAAAAVRSARGGATLAAAFTDQAGELRARCRQEESTAAGRAGVLMTAPLAACFLPAFLLLGLAPVVIGLLSSLRLW